MTRLTERLPLPGQTPGSQRSLMVHRYGTRGARPKAYLQASLHADEIPGLLVQHHLIRLLDKAAAEGAISGEIAVVPYANPIGLAQSINASHMGRHELGGAGNFNRNWPDFFEATANKVDGRLTADPDRNIALIRATMLEILGQRQPTTELNSLRLLLAREAIDADLVLDLHCDDDALMHLFMLPAHWPDAKDLAAELQSQATLLADPSGGDPFDEAFSSPWTRLARRFPGHPIPPACLSATVELRGRPDVSDELAGADAAALFRVLQRRGLIAGDPGPLPALPAEAMPLDAVDSVRAPAAGVLSYRAALGQRVKRGEVIADLIDPAADHPAEGRQEIVSGTDGLILSRRVHKYVMPGMTVAKVVGSELLPSRSGGYLLED